MYIERDWDLPILPLISLDQLEVVLRMCPALIMSASMSIFRPVFYSAISEEY